jgi:hypothetical protein
MDHLLPEPVASWDVEIEAELRGLEDGRIALDTEILAADEAAAAARDVVTRLWRLLGDGQLPAALQGRLDECEQKAREAERTAAQMHHERDRRERHIRDLAAAIEALDAASRRHAEAVGAQRQPNGLALVA